MLPLAVISLVAPAMLWALAALAAPVLIHLLARRARREITFPAVRLLDEAMGRRRALTRPWHWALLLTRCLGLAALVLAFAQPTWPDPQAPRAAPNADPAARDALVIILDNSASMGRLEQGAAIFNTARARAAALLDATGAASHMASVVITAPAPAPLLPEPTTNLAALRRALDTVRVAPTSADAQGALALAARLCGNHAPGQFQVRSGQIVIVSDMQATDWAGVAAKPGLTAATGLDQVTLIPIDAPLDNVALSSPAVVGRSTAHRPIELAVTVTNYGASTVESRVHAAVDGAAIGASVELLAPGASRRAVFTYVPAAGGMKQVAFSMSEDAQLADNLAFLALDVADRIKVALVSEHGPDRSEHSAFYVARALAPDSMTAELIWTQPSSLTATAVEGTDVLVLSDDALGEVTREVARVMAQRVAAGGCLLVFAGADSGATAGLDALNAALAADGDGGVPWSAREAQPHPSEVVRLGEGDWSWPALSVFDAQARRALTEIAHRPSWGEAPLRVGARHVLRFADGSPAVAYRPCGQGRVLLCNFRPAPDAGDLPRHGLFVALLQALTTSPDDGRFGQPIHAGQSLKATHTAAQATGPLIERWIAPDGRPVPTLRTDGQRHSTWPVTDQLGLYRAMRGDRLIAQCAVNLAPAESDPRPLNRNELDRWRDSWPHSPVVLAKAADQTVVMRSTGARPLWPWFLMLTAACLAFESALMLVRRQP